VQRHDVDAEGLAGVDHVLRVGPQRGARALPGIAAVEQQRTGTARLDALDQGCEVCEAADLAVGLCRLVEIQVREGVRVDGIRLEGEMPEQRLTDQVRHLAELVAKPEVDIWLAEVDRQQLGMAVGDVEQADVAVTGQLIHPGGSLFGQRQFAVQRHAASRCHRQHLEKLTTIHAHCLSSITASTISRPGIQRTSVLVDG
jgi:hypothetical protein